MTQTTTKTLTPTQQAKADELAATLRFLKSEMDEFPCLAALEDEHDKVWAALYALTDNPDYAY